MAPLAMRYLIEKVIRFPKAETVRLTRPMELALPDQANFVICAPTIEQDHRAVYRFVQPTLGFEAFEAAQVSLAGVELMHILCKGQWTGGAERGPTAAE